MGLSTWINRLLGKEPEVISAPALPMTDEEKELVAVIASCIVGKEKPDINLHISRITRIE